jgi:hypothetical protein
LMTGWRSISAARRISAVGIGPFEPNCTMVAATFRAEAQERLYRDVLRPRAWPVTLEPSIWR